jgi:hypothetical protein
MNMVQDPAGLQGVRFKAIEPGLDLLLAALNDHRPPPREQWVEALCDEIHGFVRDEAVFILIGKGRGDKPPVDQFITGRVVA